MTVYFESVDGIDSRRPKEDGTFLFADTPAGPITLAAISPTHRSKAVTLDVPDGESVTGIDLRIEQPHSQLAVRVVGHDGRPVSGAEVLVTQPVYQPPGALLDRNGRCVLPALWYPPDSVALRPPVDGRRLHAPSIPRTDANGMTLVLSSLPIGTEVVVRAVPENGPAGWVRARTEPRLERDPVEVRLPRSVHVEFRLDFHGVQPPRPDWVFGKTSLGQKTRPIMLRGNGSPRVPLRANKSSWDVEPGAEYICEFSGYFWLNIFDLYGTTVSRRRWHAPVTNSKVTFACSADPIVPERLPPIAVDALVTDDLGIPLAGAQIREIGPYLPFYPDPISRSGEEGRFAVETACPRIHVSAPGYGGRVVPARSDVIVLRPAGRLRLDVKFPLRWDPADWRLDLNQRGPDGTVQATRLRPVGLNPKTFLLMPAVTTSDVGCLLGPEASGVLDCLSPGPVTVALSTSRFSIERTATIRPGLESVVVLAP